MPNDKLELQFDYFKAFHRSDGLMIDTYNKITL